MSTSSLCQQSKVRIQMVGEAGIIIAASSISKLHFFCNPWYSLSPSLHSTVLYCQYFQINSIGNISVVKYLSVAELVLAVPAPPTLWQGLNRPKYQLNCGMVTSYSSQWAMRGGGRISIHHYIASHMTRCSMPSTPQCDHPTLVQHTKVCITNKKINFFQIGP